MNDSTLDEDLKVLLEKGFLTQPTYEKAVSTVRQFKKDLQTILSVDQDQIVAGFERYCAESKEELNRYQAAGDIESIMALAVKWDVPLN